MKRERVFRSIDENKIKFSFEMRKILTFFYNTKYSFSVMNIFCFYVVANFLFILKHYHRSRLKQKYLTFAFYNYIHLSNIK